MSIIEKNSVYAPGISTYGANGITGKDGKPGTSIYYIPYSRSDIESDDTIKNNIYTYIKTNKIITNNTDLLAEHQYLINRYYQAGDLFICNDGYVYILNDDGEFGDEPLGNIVSDTNTFGKSTDANVLYTIGDINNVVMSDSNTSTGDSFFNIHTTNNNIITIKYFDSNFNTTSNILELKGNNNGFLLTGSPLYVDNLLVSRSALTDSNVVMLDDNTYAKPLLFNNDISNYIRIDNDNKSITLNEDCGAYAILYKSNGIECKQSGEELYKYDNTDILCIKIVVANLQYSYLLNNLKELTSNKQN